MLKENTKTRKNRKREKPARVFLVLLASFIVLFFILFLLSRVNKDDFYLQKTTDNTLLTTRNTDTDIEKALTSREQISYFIDEFGVLPNLVRFTKRNDITDVQIPLDRAKVDLNYSNFRLTKYLGNLKWEQINGVEQTRTNSHVLTFYSPTDSLTYRFRLFYDSSNSYPEQKPKIAIIVKGFGTKTSIEQQKWLELDKEICYSILPQNRLSKMNMQVFINNGFETLLEIPMEDAGYPRVISESYSIFGHDKDTLVTKKMKKFYRLLPSVSGSITHKGSLVTTDRRIMPIILDFIKGKDIYFIDDKSIETSIAYIMAQEMLITSYEKSISLDIRSFTKEGYEEKILEDLKGLKKNPIIITFQKSDDQVYEYLVKLIEIIKRNGYELTRVSKL